MRSALICLVAACSPIPDQRPADAGVEVDAIPVDVDPKGTVHIAVLDVLGNGAPEANVTVVFTDVHGAVTDMKQSDSSGNVSATIEAGAAATAVWLKGTNYTVVTLYDIAPGDDLVFGFTQRDGSIDASTPFMVTVPSNPSATTYTLYGPCGSQSAAANVPTNLIFRKNCKPASFPVYAVARNASGPFAYSEVTSVDLAAGSVALPMSWKYLESFSASYTHVSDITNISVGRTAGTPSNGQYTGDSGVPTDHLVLHPPQAAAGGGMHAWVASSFSHMNSSQQIVQRTDAKTFAYALDVESNLLPWLDPPTFDAATRTYTQTHSAGGLPFDGIIVDIQYPRMVGMTAYGVEWLVFAPTSDPFVLPLLPASVGDVNPQATDTANLGAYLLDSSDYASWADVRPRAFEFLDEVLGQQSTAATIRASYAF